MLKNIKLKNSTILLIGLIILITGVYIGFIEYFQERKDEIYSDMNILLYENEIPKNIQENEISENMQENELVEDEVSESVQENESVENEGERIPQHQLTGSQYDYIGTLEIPKINLKRGFLDLNSRYNNVSYNITVIKGSTFPTEENNNLILAAHSGNCSICFFDKLFNLSIDDKAYINYGNIKYTYSLVNIYEVEKDGTVPIYRDYNKNVLTLITCTKYSDTKQTVFIFELNN